MPSILSYKHIHKCLYFLREFCEFKFWSLCLTIKGSYALSHLFSHIYNIFMSKFLTSLHISLIIFIKENFLYTFLWKIVSFFIQYILTTVYSPSTPYSIPSPTLSPRPTLSPTPFQKRSGLQETTTKHGKTKYSKARQSLPTEARQGDTTGGEEFQEQAKGGKDSLIPTIRNPTNAPSKQPEHTQRTWCRSIQALCLLLQAL